MTRSVIQIRLTPEQRIQLDDDRGETPLSEYVRSKLGLELGRRGVTRTINKTSTPVSTPQASDERAEVQEEQGGESGVPAADLERRIAQLRAQGRPPSLARREALEELRQ